MVSTIKITKTNCNGAYVVVTCVQTVMFRVKERTL